MADFDIPDEALQKLIQIAKTYNVSEDKLIDMFIERYFDSSYDQLSHYDKINGIIKTIELDLRDNIRRQTGEEIEANVIPFGIMNFGRKATRLFALVENKPSIISFRGVMLNELNKFLSTGYFEFFKEYKLKLVKTRRDYLYFPSFDMKFSHPADVNINEDKVFEEILKVKRVKLKDMLSGDKANMSVFSRINVDTGYTDVWDLRLFEGWVVEFTKSGFRLDDHTLTLDDMKDYVMHDNKVLRISRLNVVTVSHPIFIEKIRKFILYKVPENLREKAKVKVKVIGTLEYRIINNIPEEQLEYYRPQINAIYVKPTEVVV